MKEKVHAALDRLYDGHAAGRPLFFLFDYDGTLTPIVEHPELAHLADETRCLLKRLAAQTRIYVGVISGRMLDDLHKLVQLSGIFYAGTTGLELDLRGVLQLHPQSGAAQMTVADLTRHLLPLAEAYPGARIEPKRLGCTIHYRGVAASQVDALRADALRIITRYGNRLRLIEGAMALELTANLGWTKASAVRMLLEQIGPAPLPCYVGDEANDADALETVITLEGIAIGIGPHAPSVAPYWLPDTPSLVHFLNDFLEQLDSKIH